MSVTMQRFNNLLSKIERSFQWKQQQSTQYIPETKKFIGIINSISYAAFSVLIGKKVIYIHRFPASDERAVCPILLDAVEMDVDSNEDVEPEELEYDNISLEEGMMFWSDPSQNQSNGNFKGGSWGLDNFLPCSTWLNEAFIGETVTIEFISNGIMKFDFSSKPFQKDTLVLPNTINSAWSCNVTLDKTGKTYSAYAMNYYMSQYANDLLFIWSNPVNGKKYVKVLKRGDKPTVDMQNKLMPGAGEHLEPGENLKFKSTVMRSFSEEMGLDPEVLPNCYLLDLGLYDSPGRDPRYWEYNLIGNDGKEKTFGYPRYSCTHGHALYYRGEAPKLQQALDTDEVVEMGPNEKKWIELDKIDVTGKAWMLSDHAKIVEKSKEVLEKFDLLDESDKDKFRFRNDENEEVMSL